jgi:hypothetical protein
MKTNVFLALLFGVLAFVVGISAIDYQLSSAASSHVPPTHVPLPGGLFPGKESPPHSSLAESNFISPITGPRPTKHTGTTSGKPSSSLHWPHAPGQSPPTFTTHTITHTQPHGPRNTSHTSHTNTFSKPVFPPMAREEAKQKFKCGADDKLMSMTSRCEGRKFYACCPKGYQDLFDEDCVGLPSCKQKGKSSDKDWRKWKGVTPNGCVNCADGYSATPFFYGGCMADPLPDDFKVRLRESKLS